MTMRFHTLNSSSQLLCGLNKQKGQSKTRPYSAPFTVKSSILLQTDGNKNSSDSRSFCSEPSLEINPSDSVLNQANAVGIIGGVSAISTLNFLKKLIGWSSKNGEDSLPFIVCSDPELSKGLLSLERSSLPKPNSKNSQLQSDQTLILENLHYKRAFLEQSGARCIVMPCHIAYSWYDEIASGCSVPFFHVGECVAMELKEANLKPIEAGSNLRIGVLATEATLSAGFYQEKLQNQGFEVVLPDKATMEHTVIPAIEALNRNDTEGARNLLRIALQVLLVRAVSTVILASDDMGALLPRDDPLLKKCINPHGFIDQINHQMGSINRKPPLEKGTQERSNYVMVVFLL